ncbi:MAG: MltA domain protein [Hyphomicrobiales bacterium]|nr:MltA domain protein [Hyphomicrobiales bacterium]
MPGDFYLKQVRFGELPGVFDDNLIAFWKSYLSSCKAIIDDAPELRKATPPGAARRAASAQALALGPDATHLEIVAYLEQGFAPYLIVPNATEKRAFFTAYYRAEVRASLVRTERFREPLLARPDDLETLPPGDTSAALNGLSSARRRPDGVLEPYPTRAQIDGGALGERTRPVAYVADAIEAFMIHVQGSARLLLDDKHSLDLTYAGRNGQPYTSIGKTLIERGEIDPGEMSLARLKAWVRANGQDLGQAGRALLHANRSFVFFSATPADENAVGPIGAAGVPLTPRRSIAIDRSIWPYGLPFFVEADVPWEYSEATSMHSLVVGQDTGTAIVGPARADLYFGDGAEAGRLAGSVRHYGRLFVLLPLDGAK